MIIRSIPQLLVATALSCVTQPAFGQSFDGLYRLPAGSGEWSCKADHIGMDGGALSIDGDILEGVESRCKLTNPRAVDDSIRYFATCSADGTEFESPLTLTRTDNSVRIDRDGASIFWERCDISPGTHIKPDNTPWAFGIAQGISFGATRDAEGNSISFTCDSFTESPGLWVELHDEAVTSGMITFDVDGQIFEMSGQAAGIDTTCPNCAATYLALWEAAVAGNSMSVRASDGREARFSLEGSSDAIGETDCRPTE